MLSTPPLTPQEIIDTVLKAMEKKGDLHARISLSGGIEVDPVNKQVLRKPDLSTAIVNTPFLLYISGSCQFRVP
jgi:hypothetical protein